MFEIGRIRVHPAKVQCLNSRECIPAYSFQMTIEGFVQAECGISKSFFMMYDVVDIL